MSKVPKMPKARPGATTYLYCDLLHREGNIKFSEWYLQGQVWARVVVSLRFTDSNFLNDSPPAAD